MQPDQKPFILTDDGELIPDVANTGPTSAVYDGLSDLFLLDARNLKIINGQLSPKRAAHPGRLFSPESIQSFKSFAWKYACAVMLITMLGYLQSHDFKNALYTALYFVSTIYILWSIFWTIIRIPSTWISVAWEQRGRLIKGEVVYYKPRAKFYGFDELHYQFVTPAGNQRCATKRLYRRTGTAPHPSAGTPVAVLYVNDRLFQLL